MLVGLLGLLVGLWLLLYIMVYYDILLDIIRYYGKCNEVILLYIIGTCEGGREEKYK
jgi:hypothetical protein